MCKFLGYNTLATQHFPPSLLMAASTAAVEESQTAPNNFVVPDEESFTTRTLRRSARLAAASGALEEYESAARSAGKVFQTAANTAVQQFSATIKTAGDSSANLGKAVTRSIAEITEAQSKLRKDTDAHISNQREAYKELARTTTNLHNELTWAQSQVNQVNGQLRNIRPAFSTISTLATLGILFVLVYAVCTGVGMPSTPGLMGSLLVGIVLLSGALALMVFLCMIAS